MFQDKEKISSHQALMLVLAAGIGNICVVISVPAIKASGKDGWLPVLLGYGIATLVGLTLVKLGSRFPDKTIIQYLPKVLGKFPGKLIGLFYILGFWIFTAWLHRENSEVMLLFMPETPPIAIIILMTVLIVYTMKKGFEVFSRTLELLVPLIIFLLILCEILIIPYSEWNRLTPFLEEGFLPVLHGIPRMLAFGLETVLFMGLWLPCLNQKKQGLRAVLTGVPISGIILALVVAISIAFTGTVMTATMTSPVFYQSRYILIGQFLTGFESIYMVFWLASDFFQILVFFYPAVVGLAQWLNLKEYKPLILPMAAIAAALAMVPPNIMDTLKLDDFTDLYLMLPLGLLIPFIWLIAVIRKLDETKILK